VRWTSFENALDNELSPGSPPFASPAENHNGAGTEVLLLTDPHLSNLGTVKKGRNERVDRTDRTGITVVLLRLRGERPKAKHRREDTSQRQNQAEENAQIKHG
jgi:hypothetical protein